MSVDLPQTEEYRDLFVKDVPLLDVRAPVEFEQGAFPRALNLPLIDDDERHRIGLRYNDAGQEAAVEFGHELIQGPVKMARVAAWTRFVEQNPTAVLYCFRGGMRSKISQHWLYEATGLAIPRVRGGYKALRRFLLDELDRSVREIKPLMLGGRTGVGKTQLLHRIPYTLDLEHLAWHRGSAFGRHPTDQPSQINFENSLSVALLKHRTQVSTPIVVEDESKNIGSRHLPNTLWELFSTAPCVILEADLDERVEITLQEYITAALGEYRDLHGRQEGFKRWSAGLLNSLDRIRKRLGGARHQELRKLLETALRHHAIADDPGPHRGWIAALLSEYYDPMYDYQLEKKRHRICFRGDAAAVLQFLSARQSEH